MLISINEIRFKVVLTTIINHQSIESMMTLDDLKLPFNTYRYLLHILLYLTYIYIYRSIILIIIIVIIYFIMLSFCYMINIII